MGGCMSRLISTPGYHNPQACEGKPEYRHRRRQTPGNLTHLSNEEEKKKANFMTHNLSFISSLLPPFQCGHSSLASFRRAVPVALLTYSQENLRGSAPETEKNKLRRMIKHPRELILAVDEGGTVPLRFCLVSERW